MTVTGVSSGAPAGPVRPVRPRLRWHLAAGGLVLAWLAAAAVALLVRPVAAVPHLLLVHLLLLGAVTTAIVVWSEHFTTALMRAPALPRRRVAVRLGLLTAAAVAVLVGLADGGVAPVAGGAAVLAGVVVAHLADLLRLRRGALSGRFAGTAGFYLAAGVALLGGITAGALLAAGAAPAGWAQRLHLVHVHLNLLGWVALAVLGTQLTLWPTVLRTRIAPGVPAAARRGLVLLAAGLAAAVGGLLAGLRPVAVAGLAAYAAGVAVTLVPSVRTARARPPRSAAAWLLAAAAGWLLAAVAADTVALGVARDVEGALDALLPMVVVGFAGQALLGALTYLLPVVLGGGPAGGRRLAGMLDAGWPARLAALNCGVLLVALPLPAPVDALGWAAVGLAGLSFAVLAVLGVARGVR